MGLKSSAKLNSILLFLIRVNLLQPKPSLFLYGLIIIISLVLKCYFQVSFNLKVILSIVEITQNTVT